MPHHDSHDLRPPDAPRGFATTRWSLVLAAGEKRPDSRSALEELCRAYWYPLYRFVRNRGFDPEQAADLTQGFFARLIERNDFEKVRQEKGRFRSFLLASIRHYISNELDKANAQKRGGGVALFSIDSAAAEQKYALEPAISETPDVVFDKSWALALLEQAQAKLRSEFTRGGKSDWYEQLHPYLGGERADLPAYRELADELGVSESAVKVNVHRMRQQFRKLLRQEIANTVASEQDVDDELQRMFTVLSR